MLGKAKGYGYHQIGFVLDRGYFSRQNIRYLDKCGFDFIIMMKGMKPLVSPGKPEKSGLIWYPVRLPVKDAKHRLRRQAPDCQLSRMLLNS